MTKKGSATQFITWCSWTSFRQLSRCFSLSMSKIYTRTGYGHSHSVPSTYLDELEGDHDVVLRALSPENEGKLALTDQFLNFEAVYGPPHEVRHLVINVGTLVLHLHLGHLGCSGFLAVGGLGGLGARRVLLRRRVWLHLLLYQI